MDYQLTQKRSDLFPLRLRWLLRIFSRGETYIERVGTPRIASFDPKQLIDKALKNKTTVKIDSVFPRFREGGAFIKFTHDPDTSSAEIEGIIRAYLRNNTVRPWWNPLHRVRVRLVQGRPWVEDLYRPPSSQVKVEFLAENATSQELSQEQLYSVFRPYGKILEITPQPSDSKVLPKYASLDFADTQAAIMARNCTHGLVFKDESSDNAIARLSISYQRKTRVNWIKDWIVNHPRIVLPILVALTGAFAVAIFDPIRVFNVRNHITRAFHLTDNKWYKWFVLRATDFFALGRNKSNEASMETIWKDRKENIEQIETWLMETADTFIVVQGPRGSGKKDLVVGQALQHRKVLVIDAKKLQEARGDSPTINALAEQVGYRPVFSWMNSFSGLIDLAAQSATGMKTGFSETLDGQLTQILNTTATALRKIGLETRGKGDKDTELSDDVYLEAHPEQRPVIVIDNFLHKSQESTVVYDKLAEWAARITSANIAHVIFLTTDVSFSKSLSKALPDRVFRHIALGDTAPDVAKKFVLSHLDAGDAVEPGDGRRNISESREDLLELDECISYLGGRLTDLEFLARRIKAGETPKKAVQEIIDQSASEILKMYIYGLDSTTRQWTAEQAWTLVKALAKNSSIRYYEVALYDAFASNNTDSILQSLEQAELISIVSENGRPSSIKPGKPVYSSAFKLLSGDLVLKSKFDMAILNNQMKGENASIDKWEHELALIASLPKQPYELALRTQWLLSKIATSQQKIETYERQVARLKNILETEY